VTMPHGSYSLGETAAKQNRRLLGYSARHCGLAPKLWQSLNVRRHGQGLLHCGLPVRRANFSRSRDEHVEAICVRRRGLVGAEA
jgi:hypothetical protein